jgi:hypothetical protein
MEGTMSFIVAGLVLLSALLTSIGLDDETDAGTWQHVQSDVLCFDAW